MAPSTLRENRRSATHQLAARRNQARMMVLVQQPIYRHDSLGPGAPLREITGASDQAGFYDWAGRRLFLADGEPDPMCPGAYRYQHNPAACDEEAPDSDPRSPRYEPMHLRHQPGDTWIIDTDRPHDPYDPGPFGSPGWFKDERTGRHRRDETPDPLPAEGWVPPSNAWFPGTADWPEPQVPQDDQLRSAEQLGRDDDGDRSGGDDRGGLRGDDRGGCGGMGDRLRDSFERGGADRPPPWGPRGRPVPSDPDEPEEPQRPWGLRTGRPSSAPDTEASPARRPWDRGEPGRGGSGDAGWISEHGRRQSGEGGQREDCSGGSGSGGRRGADTCGECEGGCRGGADCTGLIRFSKLREDAFDRFIVNSAPLRDAHFAPQKPYLRERVAWVLRWLLWVFAIGLMPMPAPRSQQRDRPGSAAVHPVPAQPGPGTREHCVHDGRMEAASPGGGHDRRSQAGGPQPAETDPSRRPGAALAAAVEGARAARKVIADRGTRTSVDLAAAVRDSANRVSAARTSAAHWRTEPRQNRPRPSPRPRAGSYMASWEQAFDTGHTTILAGGRAFGAAA